MRLSKSKQRLLGASVLLLAALLLLGRSPNETTTIANQLLWRVGSAQEYDVSVDSSFVMTMPGASSGQSMAVLMDGVLEFRTLDVSPAEVLVGMRLSAMKMSVAGVTDESLNRALTLPFRVRITSNGLPRSFEFPAELAQEHREILENLVRMFQLVIEKGDAWVAEESNASGRYVAAYTRRSSTTLEKKKQRYISSTEAMAAPVPDVVSKESIRIDGINDWIAQMILEETVTSKDVNGPGILVKNHASLKLRDRPLTNLAGSNQWNFDNTAAPAKTTRQAQSTAPKISREEAERQLRASVIKLDTIAKGRGAIIYRLRDLILVDGELPFVLLNMMKTQQLSDRTRADLYLALELAGSPQAQAALTSVFTDTSWPKEDGMRAMVALGGVANPNESSLEALWNIARSTGSHHDDFPSTAALALGSLGGNLRKAGDAGYSSLHAQLLDGASTAAEPHQRAVYLHALGNTADEDPSMRSNIVPFLSDPVPEVRSAAAKALGRLGAEQVASELLRSFESEQNDVVRGSITEALAAWKKPTLQVVESVRAVIQNERDETVRYNMALLLGKSMETFPDNRRVLQELLAVEQSKRVRQQVAEMLFATK